MSHRQLRTPEDRLSAAKRDLGLPVTVFLADAGRATITALGAS